MLQEKSSGDKKVKQEEVRVHKKDEKNQKDTGKGRQVEQEKSDAWTTRHVCALCVARRMIKRTRRFQQAQVKYVCVSVWRCVFVSRVGLCV